METGCKKKAFDTREQALKRIAEINSIQINNKRVLENAYKCPLCNLWHLTSWTKAKKKKVEGQITVHKELKKEIKALIEVEYWSKRKNWK